MSIVMNNRLPILQAEIETLHAEVLSLTTTATEKALACGERLAEAKKLIDHGGWAPWLKKIGIPERTARRYLALKRTAMNSATVADLGGIVAAARWVSDAKLPKADENLALSREDSERGSYEHPIVLVWPASEGHHVGILSLGAEQPYSETTIRPFICEHAVWATVWQMLENRLNGMHWHVISDSNVRRLMDEFGETRRAA